MKKILCLIMCVFLLAGCSEGKNDSELWMTFIDDTGYEVNLSKKPEKVAVLFSSYAQIWELAGGEVAITVQETIDRGFADENAVVVDDKSGHTHIDTELLIASEPDFIIGTTDYEVQRDVAEICREAGIATALFKVENYNDFVNMLFKCGQITQNYDECLSLADELNGEVNSIFKVISVSDVQKEKILFIRAGASERSTKAKTKEDNFVCVMLDELRTYNIAENAPVLLDGLSIEEIIKEDPLHIFVSTMGDEEAAKAYVTSLLTEDGWSSLSAVKSGNVHFLPKDLFHYKPNQRWGEAYRYLAHILYPELIDE